jgi:CubicO group peptidase (beta-lactamase class C family)
MLLARALILLLGLQGVETPEDLAPLLEPVRAEHAVPALAGAIVRGGELVALGATGVRAAGSEERVSAGDLWHLGSCTKAMTATLAGRLVEHGDVKLETTIGEAFADLGERLDPAWKDVPLAWLLQHRSGAPAGLADYPGLGLKVTYFQGPDAEARKLLAEGVLAKPPAYAPGERFLYSNEAYVIAAVLLERRAGRSYEELLQREVFEPLGIESAGFGAPGSAERVDQPRGHASAEPRSAVAPGPRADNPPAYSPAGRVHMTLADWAKFAAEHVRGARGEGTLLKPETYAELHRPALERYAAGWLREPRPWAGGDALFHNGSNTLWHCFVWLAPEKDHAFLVVTNSGGDVAAKACDTAVVAMIHMAGLM